MTIDEIFKRLPRRCRQGHELTGDNIREERNQSSKGGIRIRCKACVRAQKARAYARPDFRTRQKGYARHYREGHFAGLSWSEIQSNRRSEAR